MRTVQDKIEEVRGRMGPWGAGNLLFAPILNLTEYALIGITENNKKFFHDFLLFTHPEPGVDIFRHFSEKC